MKRLIEQKLKRWKKSKRRKPLILQGARQVGKTWLVRSFAEKNYTNFVMIDFEKNPNYGIIFDKDLDVTRIMAEIELITSKKIHGMIYEFLINLRGKGLRDLKLERNF